MKARPVAYLAACILALVSACAAFKGDPKKTGKTQDKPPPVPPKLVGWIASLPADKRFVLIQSYGEWKIETGTILTSRGNDARTANLKVSGEKLGPFAAADVQSGTAEVGDAVYSRHVPKPPDPPTTAEPIENEPLPADGKIQKNN